jgi:negative regulator of sigma E activity
MGAVNALGTRIGDYQVTVVGEVPRVTVEHIGRSVQRR